MGIVKFIKGRYLVVRGARGSGRSHAEAIQAAKAVLVAAQAKPQAQEYIERVEIDVSPNVSHVRYKWIGTTGNIIGWYSEEELRELRDRLAAAAGLPLAPGVAEEIMREVVLIDKALGDYDKKGGS